MTFVQTPPPPPPPGPPRPKLGGPDQDPAPLHSLTLAILLCCFTMCPGVSRLSDIGSRRGCHQTAQVFSAAFLTRSDIRAGPLASVLNRPLPSSAPADFDFTTCMGACSGLSLITESSGANCTRSHWQSRADEEGTCDIHTCTTSSSSRTCDSPHLQGLHRSCQQSKLCVLSSKWYAQRIGRQRRLQQVAHMQPARWGQSSLVSLNSPEPCRRIRARQCIQTGGTQAHVYQLT